jgi:DNA-binding response OmpR family regulator
MGHRVLLAEDEPLIAWDVAQALTDAGYEVVGPHPSCDAALHTIRNEPLDCAVLDVKLSDRLCTDAADLLHERGVPFLFFTAYHIDLLPPHHQHRAWLVKPLERARLVQAVAGLLRSARPG